MDKNEVDGRLQRETKCGEGRERTEGKRMGGEGGE